MNTDYSITVVIADRNYKLRVTQDAEENVRKAVKFIDDLSKDYSKAYAYKDKQDLLAMVALEYVNKFVQLQEQEKFRSEGLETKLLELDALLSEKALD